MTTYKKIDKDTVEVTSTYQVKKSTLIATKEGLEARIEKKKGEIDKRYQDNLEIVNKQLAEFK